jgi:hypothetical protein
MRLKLAPGERVIVASRKQARGLPGPFIFFLLVLAALFFGLGWLDRNGAALPSWSAEWVPVLPAAMMVVAGVLILWFSARPLLRWLNTWYILTSRRLIVRRWSRKQWQENLLVGVYQVHTRQSLLQRLLRSGTLTVDLGYGRSVSFADVPEVERFRGFILSAIEGLPQTAMFDGVDMDGGQAMDTYRWEGQ